MKPIMSHNINIQCSGLVNALSPHHPLDQPYEYEDPAMLARYRQVELDIEDPYLSA